MIQISPKQIKGEWDFGYALDQHTLSSDYLGDDGYGHPQFQTTRSEIGELLYRLKYKADKSVLKIIIETSVDFINQKKWSMDLIIPVPPSHSTRSFQPVCAIAKGVAKTLGVQFCEDCLIKIKETPELKNVYDFNERLDLLKDAFAIASQDIAGRNVLLLDDLFRSGATLNAITKTLKKKGKAKAVNVITMTMTRRNA